MYRIFSSQQLGVDYGLPTEPCPAGYVGVRPYCVQDPTYTAPSTPTPTVPPVTPGVPPSLPSTPGVPPGLPTTGCPEGQYGMPPACFPIPSTDPGTKPSTPSCPGGQSWAPALNKCVPIPGGVDDQPSNGGDKTNGDPQAAAVEVSWWSERSATEKGLMVGGAAVAGFMLVNLLTS